MALAQDRARAFPESSNEAFKAFVRLFTGIAALPAVKRMRVTEGSGTLDLWVLLRSGATEEAEDQVILLEREFRQAVGAAPLEVHVLPLDDVDEANLPAGETVLER